MIEFGGWFFPDGESHLQEWMRQRNEVVDGRLTYQFHKLRAATPYCTRFRNAVDIGAHVGLWSRHLAKRFARVYAFEPVAAHRACFDKNVDAVNVTLLPCALGEQEGAVAMRSNPTSSGDTYVDVAGIEGTIPLERFDDFEYDDIDFMKLDCEGYELFALRGSERTIKRYKPVIVVEQKPGRAQKFGLPETGAVDYLQGLGYRLAQELSGDYIMVPIA